MRIIIFGIEEPLGQIIAEKVHQQLKFQVFGWTAQPQPYSLPYVNYLDCDIKNLNSINEILRGKDIVISVLPPYSTLFAEAIPSIIKGIQKRGIRRLLTIAHPHILQYDDQTPQFEHLRLSIEMFTMAQNLYNIFLSLQKTSLDWTLLCPVGINSQNHEETPCLVQLDYPPKDGKPLSVTSIATFVVQEMKNSFFLQQRVGLAQ